MLKNQKGITLIALVITIIVLLILAGVSIAMLTGPNGLLTRAEEGQISSVEGRVRDAVATAVSDARIRKYQGSDDIGSATGNITFNDIKDELKATMGTNDFTIAEKTDAGLTDGAFAFTVTDATGKKTLNGKTMTVTMSKAGAITSIVTQ